MKNLGKTIFSTGLALSLGTFLIVSPLLAETAATDKPMTAMEAPAAGMEKKEGEKTAASKPTKKKASTSKKRAKKAKGTDKLKSAEENKMETPAAE